MWGRVGIVPRENEKGGGPHPPALPRRRRIPAVSPGSHKLGLLPRLVQHTFTPAADADQGNNSEILESVRSTQVLQPANVGFSDSVSGPAGVMVTSRT